MALQTLLVSWQLHWRAVFSHCLRKK